MKEKEGKKADAPMEENKEEQLQEQSNVDSDKETAKMKNRRIIYGSIIAVLLIVICTCVYAYNDQQRKQKILDSIQIIFQDNLKVEYGTKDFDFNSLIKEKTDDVILPEQIDTMILGKKEVLYKVKKDGLTKEFPIEIEVVDTKAPLIVLKEDKVTLDFGSEYDIKNNIQSVKDPIDGDIPFTDSAGENNYWTIEGTVDTAAAGDYTITIKAVDKNKTKSEKTYTIHINEEQVEQPAYQQPSGGGYNPPVNSGSTPPSNNGGGNSGASTPPPATCEANGQWKMVGNSGIVGYDSSDVLNRAAPGCPNGYRTSVVTTKDICGKDGYTANYLPL